MEQEITITKIIRTERQSKKTGKPFTSLGLKTEEYGDVWVSGFGNKDNADWKEGDKVNVVIEKKGEYTNFSMPKRESFVGSNAQVVNLINFGVMPKLDEILAMLKGASVEEDPMPVPNFGPQDD